MPGKGKLQNNLAQIFKATITKPLLKIEKKLKPLHWSRVVLLPKEAPNRPHMIWNGIKEINLDIEEIATLFETKVKINK